MENTQLIMKRNRFLLRLLSAFYILDLMFIYAVDGVRDYWLFCLCFAIPFLFLFMFEKKMKAEWMMYSLTALLYAYLVMLSMTVPSYVNIMFLVLPLLVCTIYQNRKILIYSALFTTASQLYFFYSDFDVLLDSVSSKEISYYLLFTFLVLFFQLYYLQFSNKLWKQVNDQKNEMAVTLESTKAQLELLFSQSKDAIALLDQDYKVTAVNPAFEMLYGMQEKDLAGKKYPHGDYEPNQAAIHAGKESTITRTDRAKNGRSVEVEVALSPIYGKKGELIAHSEIIRDVTARRTEELMLIQSEKLKVAGEMAAGVAHEIRNPLTVLQGFLQILHEKAHAEYPYTKIMLSELKRLNEIVSEFLILSKPQSAAKKLFNLRDILQETINFFGTEMALKNIGIEAGDFQSYTIYGDGNQVKQVLINLLKNSSDAMPDGGIIRISLSQSRDRKAVLIISDSGTGIPADVLEKIKEPFFTTKEKGTGLGLVITEKILTQHGGSMEIESEEGRGTTVKLFLPMA
ncbi:ATP-binding protein [Bacillus sp. FJAT-42376]|uniref:ATP-binding protein n=1 Tax=Bacillus sp. FJAT-42376 TaxID=2014076 RepID=UPI0013DDB0C5|nr:ATP-binding protein [Bacillus sp. FJAT-42376]